MEESEGSEWQREPLPNFLRIPGLQNFIKEVYKGKKAVPYPQDVGLHNFELDLGDAAYDFAVLDGPVKETWGDLTQWFNAEHGYDGTLPKIAPPKESDELDIQPEYNDLFWENHSIDSIAKRIASKARDENSDPPIDIYHKPKPFLRGLIDFQNIFGHGATEDPLDEYSKQNLREDLIAASMFHHIATTILRNPFFFLDDVKKMIGTEDGPHNPVDKLYHDILQYESLQNQLVAKSFRAHTLRLLRPQEEYSHSKSIAARTNGKIRRVAQARAKQWLRSEAQDLWLPTTEKIDEHEVEILYERAAELAVAVASMTWTDIQIETLDSYTPLPHPTIPCLPLSFWKHYKADPALHHISDMSKYLLGDIPVPPQDLKELNELEKQVKLVRCRLVMYVHIQHPENLDPKQPYLEVEGYPFLDAAQVKECPEQLYLELPELEKQEPDPRKLERIYSDEDLPRRPPILRGMFGEKVTWRKVWKFYKWLFDSALYYIPFYAVALGVPFVVAYGFYRLPFLRTGEEGPSLRTDEEGLPLSTDKEYLHPWNDEEGVAWRFLPNIRNLNSSWRDALSSNFFRILGWLGILKLYDLAMTALYNLFGRCFGIFAYGWGLALHSVTTSREFMSGLYDATAGYIVSTTIWNLLIENQEFAKGFLTCFIMVVILYFQADRLFVGAPGLPPWYLRPLTGVLCICQSLWFDSVRRMLSGFAGYVLDVPKTVMDMFGDSFHLPETFNWVLEWISGIGGDTSVSIIPEFDPSQAGISIIPQPEPGTSDGVPQPFQLSPDAENTLSESTLGNVLTGSKLGGAILISNLSKEQGLSSIAEMLERSELGRILGLFGFRKSVVGRGPIEQSLKGSLLGYILTGSDTEKRLVTTTLGATLAKSDLAEMFAESEIAKSLPQSELAGRITEALNIELGLEGPAQKIPSVPMLGKVLTGLNLAETLEGSLLGKIITGSTSGPILPIGALTAWEGLTPPIPYLPRTLVMEVEPYSQIITKIVTIVMKPITTILSPFQMIVTRIVSVMRKAPMIESLLPMVATVANEALKPFAPVIGFLSGVSYNGTTELSTHVVSGHVQKTGTPIAESVLPIIAKAFTKILKPVASLVAMFSGFSFPDSPITYLKITFNPTIVSFVIAWILGPAFVCGFYIALRRYINAWGQADRDRLPHKWNLPRPLIMILDLLTYVFRKLRSAYHIFLRFLGALGRLIKYVFRPFVFLLRPFIWLYAFIAPVLRPFRWLGYPFVYVYRQITRVGVYTWRLIPSGRYLLLQVLTLIVFVLYIVFPLLEYAYWLFALFEDFRHPRPQLPQIPFINGIVGFVIRVYEMVLQLFADIRQKLIDWYNFLHLNAFAPIQGVIDATLFLYRQIARFCNFFFRTSKLVYYCTAFLIYVMFGWDTAVFFAPGQNPEILLALRAIRAHLWKSPFAAVRVPGRKDDLAYHHFPGFAQGRHRSLPHPQWFPYFHLLIGASIGIFIYLTTGHHPSGPNSLLQTSDLNSTLDKLIET
ncbi:hypothetical protein BPOR_0098g00050 [Botrytis porri]|uniref:Uncharacterized protein n=1 Tax=Botrytis porri TaxID=87229 RepID=A0A4Z1KYT7_9HELO|nr:hypothetical protein BPOR_0098g00050 [Botrytis porri]